MFRILVCEDDDSQRTILSRFLHLNGYEVFALPDASAALAQLEQTSIDLCIIDVMMPGMDGYELTRAIRSFSDDMPILMITARSELRDKQEGFTAGVDDYMVKPVDLDEMLLRIKALYRRARIASDHFIIIGDTRVDDADYTVKTAEETIDLPKKEFDLLFMLLSYPGTIFTRRQLMDEIWGLDCDTDERTVDVHIKRLREKLASVQDFDIVTLRGVGYRAEVQRA